VADRDLVAERSLELPLRRALGISVDRDLDLLITAATSVRASQNGLPVSREISVANSFSRLRTTLAKRRTASVR